jgi:hypothetical protein
VPRPNEIERPLRRPQSRSRWTLDTPQLAEFAVVGLLFLLAGFSVVKFMLNFDLLQRLEEESGSGGTAETRLRGGTSGAESVSAETAGPVASVPELRAWLAPLNRYREMVGLPPVTADAQLSRGDSLHSHYLAVNYASLGRDLHLGADAHSEDVAKPGFSDEGAAAARASDVDWVWDPRGRPGPWWAIDNWMQAPFHRMPIINPYLRRVGYGTECREAVCFAALNTGTDVARAPAIPAPWPKPVIFPPDGSVIEVGEFSGEWPDPLTSCPGYTSPAGLPITIEFGHLVETRFSEYSISKADDGTLIEACAFDANTYVNADPMAQATARAILRDFGAIVIVPRPALSPGRYIVTLTAGQKYSWSFSIAAASS